MALHHFTGKGLLNLLPGDQGFLGPYAAHAPC